MRSIRLYVLAAVAWTGGAWGTWAAGAFAEEPARPKESDFAFKLLDERQEFRHTSNKNGETFEITGGGRGGKVDITLTEGAWPADIVVRISGAFFPDFMVDVDNGSVKLFGKLAYDKMQSDEKRSVWTNPTVCWFDDKGKGLDKLSSRVKYIMSLTYAEEGQVMEVILPPHFCGKDVKALRLHWINALER